MGKCQNCVPGFVLPNEDIEPGVDPRAFLSWESVGTSQFGWRQNPFTGQWVFHSGFDLAPVPNTGLYAHAVITPLKGQLTREESWGLYYRPEGWPKRAELFLGHMFLSASLRGMSMPLTVNPGDIMGHLEPVGNIWGGAHLHIELWYREWRYNPAFVLK
jgi:hypothetical protein